MTKTAEQQARDLLERMGVEDAQQFSSGDLVELANLIACRNDPQLVQCGRCDRWTFYTEQGVHHGTTPDGLERTVFWIRCRDCLAAGDNPDDRVDHHEGQWDGRLIVDDLEQQDSPSREQVAAWWQGLGGVTDE